MTPVGHCFCTPLLRVVPLLQRAISVFQRALSYTGLMAFTYTRIIRFQETDAAGVVYFANLLTLCHEAYEASLAASGIRLKQFFSGGSVAVPVVHAESDFQKPLFCGDRVRVDLIPVLLRESEFEISYTVSRIEFEQDPLPQSVAHVLTRHVCIQTEPRQRVPLTEELQRWLGQWQESAG